jgi:hypothetical protein
MTTSSPARFSLLMALGLFLLAVVGVGLIVLAVVSLSRPAAARPTPTVTLAVGDATVFIPTTTPLPPTAPPTATLEPTAEPPPTDTPAGEEPPPTEAPAVVRIVGPANVRSGPGLTYAVLGGLNSGDTAPVAGRDATSQWYAISFAGGANGVGWVSNLVATYDGDVQALPVMQANEPPPPAATAPPAAGPAPTNTSPAPAAPTNTSPPPVSGARGIVANSFSIENTTAGAGADVWFNFEVRNTTQNPVGYGVLAAHTDVGFTAQSWTNETLQPGQVLTWRDHINIGTPGTYQVYLGICFSSRDACLTGGAPWERLSNSITVTIQ